MPCKGASENCQPSRQHSVQHAHSGYIRTRASGTGVRTYGQHTSDGLSTSRRKRTRCTTNTRRARWSALQAIQTTMCSTTASTALVACCGRPALLLQCLRSQSVLRRYKRRSGWFLLNSRTPAHQQRQRDLTHPACQAAAPPSRTCRSALMRFLSTLATRHKQGQHACECVCVCRPCSCGADC